MAAGDMADRVRHRQHSEAKGEGYAHKTDAQIADFGFGVGGGQYGAATAAEDQPEGADKFGERPFGERHGRKLLSIRLNRLDTDEGDLQKGVLHVSCGILFKMHESINIATWDVLYKYINRFSKFQNLSNHSELHV